MQLHRVNKARILGAMKRIGVVLILVLAFFGISDSVYLAQNETSNTPLICNVESLSDCNIVAASQYSRLFGIPIAEFGVVFYGILFVLAAIELALFNRFLRRILQAVSLVGVVVSIYFSFVEVFVINALCIYCIVSSLITLLIFISASFIEPIRPAGGGSAFGVKEKKDPPRPPYFSMPPS